MIQALKPFILGLLLHLYIQIDILIQIKVYDSAPNFSGVLAVVLPIVFGIIVYRILKNITKKQFWITVVSFIAVYIGFLILGETTNYFKWLFNLTNLSVFYDNTYYELGINAMLDGFLHTISIVVVFVIYLIKLKKTK